MRENNSEMYLLEGTVETDPVTGHCTIRAEKDGKPFSFDPQDALKHFAGREVRFVMVELATYVQLQSAMREMEADGQAEATAEMGFDPEGQN